MKTSRWLISISRNSSIRSWGKQIEHNFKRFSRKLFQCFITKLPPVNPQEMTDVRRILLLRPNFRIGNILISTPLISVFRTRFPVARLDYLGADTTAILLNNFPLDHIYTMSRSHIMHPWSYFNLLRKLHRTKYDLVVQIGNDSFSGMLYIYATGARYRMGAGKWAKGTCNIELDMSESRHAYDDPMIYAQALGTPCRNRPLYIPSSVEQEKTLSRLEQIHLSANRKAMPFLALFCRGT